MRSSVLLALSGVLVVGSAAAWPQLPPIPSIAPWPSVFPGFPPLPTVAVPALPNPVPLGPLTRGPDYAIKPRVAVPKLTQFAVATPHVKFAPDDKTLLLHSSVTRIGSETNAFGAALGSSKAYRSAWSPDSKRVVTSEENGTLTVWNTNGTVARKVENAFQVFGSVGSSKYTGKEVSFLDSNVVLFHDGCRLMRLDLASPAPPAPLGLSNLCGYPSVSRDGKRWILLQEGSKMYGLGIWYVRAYTFDLTTGATKVFLDSAQLPSWTDVRLSPKGDRLCFLKINGRAGCVGIDDGKLEDVSDAEVERMLVFDADGGKLLWADKSSGAAAKGLHVVDFAARTMRRIAQISGQNRSWGFFTGGTRVLAQGYDGATAFDLANGWSLPIFVGGESESFFAIPGTPKRAFVGRAVGPSTNLFRLELPD